MHCIVTCDQLTAAFTGPVHPLPHSIGPLAKSSTMTGQQTSPHWHSLYFISYCNCICHCICQIFVFEFGSTAPTMTGQRRPSPKWLLMRQPKGQLVKHLTIPRCHFCAHVTREPPPCPVFRAFANQICVFKVKWWSLLSSAAQSKLLQKGHLRWM